MAGQGLLANDRDGFVRREVVAVVFEHSQIERGVFLPPSQFEALFVSAAHTEQEIDETIAACRESLKAILVSA